MAAERIHMVASEPVCVFYDPLLTDIHQDGLTAHSADIVREVLGRHSRCAVVLGEGKKAAWDTVGFPDRRDHQGQRSSTYPHSGSHEVCTHFSKVSSENPIVKPVEEQRHTKIHCIFGLYPKELRPQCLILTHFKKYIDVQVENLSVSWRNFVWY